MIQIIPKPYRLIDKNKKIKIKGFNIICPDMLSNGLNIFVEEFSSYINNDFKLFVKYKNHDNDEAYILNINEDSIIIEVKTEKALFYALSSLKQLISYEQSYLEINLCDIYDKPKMRYRSFSFDEVRHFFGVEEVKKIIDILGMLKINYFHWHLSDDQGFRVNFKKLPKLYEIGSKRLKTQVINDTGDIYEEKVYQYCYEEEEIKEIIEYAKKRYISVIPEFDVPGHTASLVAAYPYLHCFDKQIDVYTRQAGNYDIICPSKETTYEFLDVLFEQIMSLFKDSEYIHLGGDEVIPTNWEKCPHCQKKMKELNITNPHDLQGYFSNRFISMIKKYNKKMIMWHDGIKNDTDKDIILQYWVWQMDKAGIDKINAGRNTIYSVCSQFYFDCAYAELPLKRTYQRGIKLDGLTSEGKNKIFGYECCSWNEFIDNFDFLEFMIFPRIHAFSETAWTDDSLLDYDDFRVRLKYHFNILDNKGINYCKEHLLDNDENEEVVSPIFRKYYRYIEYHQN